MKMLITTLLLAASPADHTITGDLNVYASDGNGAYWAETHVGSEKVSPGGSGATLTVGGPGGASIYWQLDAVTEYLYHTTDIEDDWDGISDIPVTVKVSLDGAETANDDIEFEVIAEYWGEHENMDTAKTQTRTVNHDIGNENAAGDSHTLVFLLDWDLGGNVIEVDDILKLRFRLDGVGSVAAVRYTYGNIKYRSSKPSHHTDGTFPTEG